MQTYKKGGGVSSTEGLIVQTYKKGGGVSSTEGLSIYIYTLLQVRYIVLVAPVRGGSLSPSLPRARYRSPLTLGEGAAVDPWAVP